MIQANELRIGNYVNEYYWNNIKNCYSLELIKIKGIYETHIVCNEEDAYNLSELKPIPLTEEILFKCGFVEEYEDEEDNSYFVNSSVEIMKVLFKQEFFLENIDNISLKIKYLHQLQNLYFALIGKELEINL